MPMQGGVGSVGCGSVRVEGGPLGVEDQGSTGGVLQHCL